MFAYPEPVEILSPGTVTDPYSGETVKAWDLPAGSSWTTEPTSRDEGCGVAPGGSSEPTIEARNAIDADFDLIFDHDPHIKPSDRIVVPYNGELLTCEVDGRPQIYRSPFTGWDAGVLVRVKIREG